MFSLQKPITNTMVVRFGVSELKLHLQQKSKENDWKNWSSSYFKNQKIVFANGRLQNEAPGSEFALLGLVLAAVPLMLQSQSTEKKKDGKEEVVVAKQVQVVQNPATKVKSAVTLGGLGGFLGFAAGYAGKKSLKVLLFLIGGEFILLQILAFAGYIEIYWNKVETTSEKFLKGKEETITERFKQIITHNLPFKAGLLTGFTIGFKYG